MKYSTSEAVKLWLCIDCGYYTSVPAQKRRHFSQIANTPQRLTPQKPKRRSLIKKEVEQKLSTIQRENYSVFNSQIEDRKLWITHKT